MDFGQLLAAFTVPILTTFVSLISPRARPPLQIPPGVHQVEGTWTHPEQISRDYLRQREAENQRSFGGIFGNLSGQMFNRGGAEALYQLARNLRNAPLESYTLSDVQQRAASHIRILVDHIEKDWSLDEMTIQEIEGVLRTSSSLSSLEGDAITQLATALKGKTDRQKGHFERQMKDIETKALEMGELFVTSLKDTRFEYEKQLEKHLDQQERTYKLRMSALVVGGLILGTYFKNRGAKQMIWTDKGLYGVPKGSSVAEQIHILQKQPGNLLKPLTGEVVESVQKTNALTPQQFDNVLSYYNQKLLESQASQQLLIKRLIMGGAVGGAIIALGVVGFMIWKSQKEAEKLRNEFVLLKIEKAEREKAEKEKAEKEKAEKEKAEKDNQEYRL